MKKRLICVFLALACLAGGVFVFAEDGSGRSLVSVSYLTETFLSSLTQSIRSAVSAGFQDAGAAALEQLDQLGREYLSGLSGETSGWVYSDTHRVVDVKRGDTLSLAPGSTALWRTGAAAVTAGLVDATAAADVPNGARLTSGHRYLNAAEDALVTVRVLSDAAQLLLEGCWLLEEAEEDATPFTDLLQDDDWFYDGVYYVVKRGLFLGVSATQFSPEETMNRAMLATVLHRLAGSPQAAYTPQFTDVPSGEWYSQSITWASQSGVVKGLEDGSFGVEDDVTREQIATMLCRYARDWLGMNVSHTGELSAYRDCALVSDWAVSPMSWAVGVGIINGTDANELLPGDGASRAEVAVMLQRFEAWIS